nr:hypothetical protein [Planctomycetota bacterium]
MKCSITTAMGSVVLLAFSVSLCEGAEPWVSVSSPGGGLTIEFSVGEKGKPRYRVRRGQEDVILPS